MAIQLSDHFTFKKLLQFCASPMLMMVFISIYSVVDGFFVSNYVGKTALAAVNLIWPFLMVLGCFGFMVGTGGSALVAKTLGEVKKELANQYFSMLVIFTVVAGIVLVILGMLSLKRVALLFGATESMLEDCLIYGRILLLFTVFYMLQNVFQNFLSVAEKPKLGLFATLAAGLANMILDALFIRVLHWGVAGAALGTGLGQVIGGVLPLVYFCLPNSSRLQFVMTRPDWGAILKACGNGISELMSNISSSIVSILYNLQLLHYAGEDGVAAYSVLMYVQFVFLAIDIGYVIGTAPIVSYHYGAGHQDELKNLLRKGLFFMVGLGLIMVLLAQLLAAPLAEIFVGYDRALCDMTTRGFRISSFSFLLAGINILASSFFTALNNGAVSAAISFLRTLVFQLLAILLLPRFLTLDGIWLAVVAAEILAVFVSASFLIALRKRYRYG